MKKNNFKVYQARVCNAEEISPNGLRTEMVYLAHVGTIHSDSFNGFGIAVAAYDLCNCLEWSDELKETRDVKCKKIDRGNKGEYIKTTQFFVGYANSDLIIETNERKGKYFVCKSFGEKRFDTLKDAVNEIYQHQLFSYGYSEVPFGEEISFIRKREVPKEFKNAKL